MKILGISGIPDLQKSISKSNNKTHLTRVCQGLDSAVSIIENGKLLFSAAEERFTGEKGTGEFPINAITAGMSFTKTQSIDDFDLICHGFDYANRPTPGPADLKELYSKENIARHFEESYAKNVRSKLASVPHHLAHAYSSIFCSGFSSGLCVVADGMGEVESITVYLFTKSQIERMATYPISKSLGIFYSIYTKFLGFEFNMDEYKVMGMSAYGKNNYATYFQNKIKFENEKLSVQFPNSSSKDTEYEEAIKIIADELKIPCVADSSQLSQAHYDVAHSLQRQFETTMVSLIEYWLKKTKQCNLALAGGVFLNCLMNQKLSELQSVKDMFIQPASGDDGTSLGAAIYGLIEHSRQEFISPPAFNPHLGPEFQDTEIIENILLKSSVTYEYVGEKMIDEAATSIANGKVIAWFKGRMEFGPRALGARSILANPRTPGIKEKINRSVKFRELFRPFAPALLSEDAEELFDFKNTKATRYMLQTAPATAAARNLIPGVIHEDGTARIQIVDPEINPSFYNLLLRVKSLTGTGCVLNTSFNLKGQPLICDPKTAIDTFQKSDIDHLFLEGYKISKGKI
ncbi:carbamoyltransferase family protein [Burkholderia cepacia]|uniref:carbamoyltransferase family protein n=1 Tax=Burkholderia cepacia TaxID=292 RepID=UPI002AB638F4|nr:carbamoyltransferase C-terminal domain-containing protein [Burkholderia cepacia]